MGWPRRGHIQEDAQSAIPTSPKPLYHAGKVANIQDVSNKLIAKLGRNHITLADEVEEGEPRISGAMELENHLRLSLFAKLDTISGNRGEEAT